MTEQAWCCPKCEKEGEVTFEKGAGVYEVLNLLEDSHRAASPDCDQPRMALIASTKEEAIASGAISP